MKKNKTTLNKITGMPTAPLEREKEYEPYSLWELFAGILVGFVYFIAIGIPGAAIGYLVNTVTLIAATIAAVAFYFCGITWPGHRWLASSFIWAVLGLWAWGQDFPMYEDIANGVVLVYAVWTALSVVFHWGLWNILKSILN